MDANGSSSPPGFSRTPMTNSIADGPGNRRARLKVRRTGIVLKTHQQPGRHPPVRADQPAAHRANPGADDVALGAGSRLPAR